MWEQGTFGLGVPRVQGSGSLCDPECGAQEDWQCWGCVPITVPTHAPPSIPMPGSRCHDTRPPLSSLGTALPWQRVPTLGAAGCHSNAPSAPPRGT